jgi:mannonate dehydratase
MQEYMMHSPATLEVFRTTFSFENGMLAPSEAPGLGIEYDDEAAAGYAYASAYLPVNRLLDGSMHDW